MASNVLKVGVVGLRPYFIGGHDPDNDIRKHIKYSMYTYLEKLKDCTVLGLTGLGIGIEQDFAVVCSSLAIDYYAYLPFAEQESRWKYLPTNTIPNYLKLLNKAIGHECVSEGNYSPHKNILKTLKVISSSDHIIWVHNKRLTNLTEVNNAILNSNKTIYEICV
jgi:hypothetical protein